jgi:hypothetical protein
MTSEPIAHTAWMPGRRGSGSSGDGARTESEIAAVYGEGEAGRAVVSWTLGELEKSGRCSRAPPTWPAQR